MADKDDQSRLLGIELCESIEAALAGKSYEEFGLDDVLRDAIAYRIAAIGEECRELSDDIKAQHDLPWKQIVGMRNRLSHGQGWTLAICRANSQKRRIQDL